MGTVHVVLEGCWRVVARSVQVTQKSLEAVAFRSFGVCASADFCFDTPNFSVWPSIDS